MYSLGHYGLHEIDHVDYLIESKTSIENVIGLNSAPPVSLVNGTTSPHRINIKSSEKPSKEFLRELKSTDPLVDFMKPIPKNQPYIPFLEQTTKNLELIHYLSKMSNPTRQTVFPEWSVTDETLKGMLNSSNLLTVVLIDCDNMNRCLELAKLAFFAPAKLLLVGDKDTPLKDLLKPIKTKQKLRNIHLNEKEWKTYGKECLVEYMRKCQKS